MAVNRWVAGLFLLLASSAQANEADIAIHQLVDEARAYAKARSPAGLSKTLVEIASLLPNASDEGLAAVNELSRDLTEAANVTPGQDATPPAAPTPAAPPSSSIESQPVEPFEPPARGAGAEAQQPSPVTALPTPDSSVSSLDTPTSPAPDSPMLALPEPAPPAPTSPAPDSPAPVLPAPTSPAPALPALAMPEPVAPTPAAPAPALSALALPEPASPTPAAPAPDSSASIQAAPAAPTPASPVPARLEPAAPTLAVPAPASPAPVSPVLISPVVPSAAALTATAVAPRASPALLDLLRRQGAAALGNGDISGARRFFQRGAEAGCAPCAEGMAQTFDAEQLSRIGAIGIRPDPAQAEMWRARARQLMQTSKP